MTPSIHISTDDYFHGIVFLDEQGLAGDDPTIEELRELGASDETIGIVEEYRVAQEALGHHVFEWIEKRPDIDPDGEMVHPDPRLAQCARRAYEALVRDLGDRALVTIG